MSLLVMSLLVVVVDERLSAMGRRLETRGGVRLLVTGCSLVMVVYCWVTEEEDGGVVQ